MCAFKSYIESIFCNKAANTQKIFWGCKLKWVLRLHGWFRTRLLCFYQVCVATNWPYEIQQFAVCPLHWLLFDYHPKINHMYAHFSTKSSHLGFRRPTSARRSCDKGKICRSPAQNVYFLISTVRVRFRGRKRAPEEPSWAVKEVCLYGPGDATR